MRRLHIPTHDEEGRRAVDRRARNWSGAGAAAGGANTAGVESRWATEEITAGGFDMCLEEFVASIESLGVPATPQVPVSGTLRCGALLNSNDTLRCGDPMGPRGSMGCCAASGCGAPRVASTPWGAMPPWIERRRWAEPVGFGAIMVCTATLCLAGGGVVVGERMGSVYASGVSGASGIVARQMRSVQPKVSSEIMGSPQPRASTQPIGFRNP